MTYNLTNNCLVPVRSIRHNGRRISNPPDDLVISLGLGYPLITTPVPEYNPETQYVTKSWRQDENAIVEVWTVHDIQPEPEPEPETSDSSTSESETEVEPSNQVEVEE